MEEFCWGWYGLSYGGLTGVRYDFSLVLGLLCEWVGSWGGGYETAVWCPVKSLWAVCDDGFVDMLLIKCCFGCYQ